MENFKIIKKAYEINFHKIREGYLASEKVVHAKTRGEAKSLLLAEICYEDWKINFTGEDITYLNIPVVRVKNSDIVIFEGNEVRRYQIDNIINNKKRNSKLEEILNDKNIEFCYIYKGGYYRPNSCGYTDSKARAGVYTKEEAISDAKMCREISILPINISEHNTMINKEIEDYKTRLIQ